MEVPSLALVAGAFGYADDIALVAPSLSSLKQMIGICEKFAKCHSIVFNPSKTNLFVCDLYLRSNLLISDFRVCVT